MCSAIWANLEDVMPSKVSQSQKDLCDSEVGDWQAPGWAAAPGLLLGWDTHPLGILVEVPVWHMRRKGPQFSGRTKKAEDASWCLSWLRDIHVHQDQRWRWLVRGKKPWKLPLCKQPKPTLSCKTHPELFRVYFASNKRFHLFHNLGLLAEIFLPAFHRWNQFYLYEVPRIVKIIGTEISMVISRGWEYGWDEAVV